MTKAENPAACIQRFDYCARCDAAITDKGRALNCGFCHDGRLFCGRACATKHMIDKHPEIRAALDAAPEGGEPVAWGMLDGNGMFRMALSRRESVEDEANRRNSNEENQDVDRANTVVPLYARPTPPTATPATRKDPTVNDIPRRIDISRQTPIEAAIRAARQAVEEGPAHYHMTRATVLLGQALDAVADFVDGVPETPADPASKNGTCPACPVEVRDLCATAHNYIINTNPCREAKKRAALIESLARMKPIVDAHFAAKHTALDAPEDTPPPATPASEAALTREERAFYEAAWHFFTDGDDGPDGECERIHDERFDKVWPTVDALLAAERAKGATS